MDNLKLSGVVLLVLGLVFAVLGFVGFPDSLGGGYITFLGYALIILAVILFIIHWNNSK